MGDQEAGRGTSEGEKRWLHEANAAAAVFYREELLHAAPDWPSEVLERWHVEEVLDPGSAWSIGYAPDSGTRLIDHLQKQGFGRETLMRAGLMSWTNDRGVADRYQDKLVMVSRDRQLDPVGFVGIDRRGQATVITPETPVHRPAASLVGVLEQVDAFKAGAMAVIVDHPLDAIGVQLAVAHARDLRYVGIPLLGAVSQVQAQILQQHSEPSRLIVTVAHEVESAELALENALELTFAFDEIRVYQRPPGPLLGNTEQMQIIADLVVSSRSTGPSSDNGHDATLGNEDPGPSL
ncbi:hypothetical protein GCM10009554_43100 [Kribbella koreensis]|uniref:DNA primase DNAG catalytic core N-terminal domain-containing protein n=1 Tax=Kribbella koreensis TaxID=57909 RepID=A0ABN1QSS7_9ACTN